MHTSKRILLYRFRFFQATTSKLQCIALQFLCYSTARLVSIFLFFYFFQKRNLKRLFSDPFNLIPPNRYNKMDFETVFRHAHCLEQVEHCLEKVAKKFIATLEEQQIDG